MNSYAEEIKSMLDEAELLDVGEPKFAILENAVRLADVHRDTQLGFRARIDLINVSSALVRTDIAITHLAWCLAQSDQDPDQFSPLVIIISYRAIIGCILDTSDMPIHTAKDLLKDFERRIMQLGDYRHAYLVARHQFEIESGAVESAMRTASEFRFLRPTVLSGCIKCVNADIIWASSMAQDWKAVEQLYDIMLASSEGCGNHPKNTHSRVLLPLLALLKTNKATVAHKLSIRHHLSETSVFRLGDHARFLAVVNDPGVLHRVLRRGFELWDDNKSEIAKFNFCLGIWSYLRYRKLSSKTFTKLRLPSSITMPDRKGIVTHDALLTWASSTATELAHAFDNRNGNNFYVNHIKVSFEILDRCISGKERGIPTGTQRDGDAL